MSAGSGVRVGRDGPSTAAAAADRVAGGRQPARVGQRLSTMVRLGRQVAAGRPADEVMTEVVEVARGLLDGAYAVLRVVEGDELVAAAVAPQGNKAEGWPALRPGQGLDGRVALGSPLRIADLSTGSGSWVAGCPARVARKLRAYVGVPLLGRARVVGTLSVWRTSAGRCANRDVTLLAGLASQATIAVEQGQLTRQLLHAERLATIGEMIAGVAHELKNSLTAVIGTADIIRRQPVDASVATRIERISDQAQRAGEIVRALLTLARKTSPERTPVDVNALLDDVLELGAFELRRGQIVVVREFGDNLPQILGDPIQLQQVFTNLCLNASEAMCESRGGGVLTVATRRDPGSGWVVVTVTDDGPGISPHHRSRVFEPFFTTKAAGKGTGLGLTMCRRIVEDYGGQIRVESGPGAGTTFIVELPQVREEPALAAVPVRGASGPVEKTPLGCARASRPRAARRRR
jgi:signal transduction histidine kinase